MSINPFNEQVALARQVLTVFDSSRLIEQLHAFVAWATASEVSNRDPSRKLQELRHQEFQEADDTEQARRRYLEKKKELDAILETPSQNTAPGIPARQKHIKKLEGEYNRLQERLTSIRAEIKTVETLLEPNPWSLLTCTEPEHSTDAHATKLVRHCFPPGPPIGLNANQWLCLRCARVSILHDKALPNDYPQLTAGILDKEQVDSVWEQMSGDWLTWGQALEYDIKRLQSDADTQGLLKTAARIGQQPNEPGQPNPAEAKTASGKRSKPMSKTKMMRALKVDSPKTLKAWLADKNPQTAGNRQTWTICTDGLDPSTIAKLEKA